MLIKRVIVFLSVSLRTVKLSVTIPSNGKQVNSTKYVNAMTGFGHSYCSQCYTSLTKTVSPLQECSANKFFSKLFSLRRKFHITTISLSFNRCSTFSFRKIISNSAFHSILLWECHDSVRHSFFPSHFFLNNFYIHL